VWEALVDPQVLADLSPLVDHIGPRGDLWRWRLVGIPRFGIRLLPSFTERMTFTPISRIECRHEPQPGVVERAGIDGLYLVTKVDGGSKLVVDLTLCLEVPLPAFGRPLVEGVLRRTMARARARFVKNLCHHLAIDPDAVSTRLASDGA